MPHDDPTNNGTGRTSASIPLTTASQSATQPKRSIFSLPAPVKRVFDRFPLKEYERNELPLRVQKSRAERGRNTLHIFAAEEDAKLGRPSFNPGCLRWQTYLLFRRVDLDLVPSSNHASPSGSLPFLQPATTCSSGFTPDPVPANKLRKWIAKQQREGQGQGQDHDQTTDPRLEVYQSLVDSRLRKAWLYQLYLAPQNDSLMRTLYVLPCSNNSLVRLTLTRQLRAAAEAELVKSAGSNVVDAEMLLTEVEEAFEALSVLLGEGDDEDEEKWFLGLDKPGMFDASVFAYTHLLLDEGLGWEFNPVGDGLRKWGNLVRHRERILSEFYNDGIGNEEVGRREAVRSSRQGIHGRTTSTLGKRKDLKG